MGYVSEFHRELDELFDRRAQWLNSLFEGRRPGPPRKLTRTGVNRAIARLQDLASEVFAHELARKEFESHVYGRKSWHPKRGKGHGRPAKKSAFNDWFDTHIGAGPTIYVFWNGRDCEYVGKTSGNGRRVSSHFDKHWFGRVSRVDVYVAKRRRNLPALECLADHRFLPLRNRVAPERRKWTRHCPMCSIHEDIEDELRSIFRLR